MKKTVTFPIWAAILIAALIIAAALWLGGVFAPDVTAKTEQHAKTVEVIKDKTRARDSISRSDLDNSQKSADQATTIIKNLPTSEKPNIPDTTYSAMSKYVRGFEPN